MPLQEKKTTSKKRSTTSKTKSMRVNQVWKIGKVIDKGYNIQALDTSTGKKTYVHNLDYTFGDYVKVLNVDSKKKEIVARFLTTEEVVEYKEQKKNASSTTKKRHGLPVTKSKRTKTTRKIQRGYNYARESSVARNRGEDVVGSARHLWWQFKDKSLEELEEMGVAFKLINKKQLLPELSIEDERAKGKSAGHIYYRKVVYSSITASPPDTKEAREYYKREVELILKFLDESDTFTELQHSLQDYFFTKELSERKTFKDIMSQRMVNVMFASDSWRAPSEAVRKHCSHARSLESVADEPITYPKYHGYGASRSQYGTTEVPNRKSNEADYKRLEEALQTTSKKKKTNPLITDLKNWRTMMLQEHGDYQEKRFDYRTAKSTLDKTMQDYKLRAFQWGNSVTDQDRKPYARLAYGSFHDLAKQMRMNKEDISMGGNLALAIGARGKGAALAHYEPPQRIINLTNNKGNGSIAHEYAHFIDHMMHRASNKHKVGKVGLATREGYLRFNNDDLNYDVRKKWLKLRELIASSEFRRKCAFSAYYNSMHECFARAFESYMGDRVTDNPYLVHQTALGKGDESNPFYKMLGIIYPQGGERYQINEAFDEFFEAMEGQWYKFYLSLDEANEKDKETAYVKPKPKPKPKETPLPFPKPKPTERKTVIPKHEFYYGTDKKYHIIHEATRYDKKDTAYTLNEITEYIIKNDLPREQFNLSGGNIGRGYIDKVYANILEKTKGYPNVFSLWYNRELEFLKTEFEYYKARNLVGFAASKSLQIQKFREKYSLESESKPKPKPKHKPQVERKQTYRINNNDVYFDYETYRDSSNKWKQAWRRVASWNGLYKLWKVRDGSMPRARTLLEELDKNEQPKPKKEKDEDIFHI